MSCKNSLRFNTIYRANKIYEYLAKILFWNLILRMIMEGYIDYAISSLLNVNNVMKYMTLILVDDMENN